ncbi:sulfatase [Phytoactinopolyspora endophytica]|uniref:sulfatase family protein n=1 Tax=Phytoactinopolyspora endophytica TaxID=1642495 RepID=UPI00101D768B|nr:sulfatase-like hydrolase/transferase [Phytoactinopolyspora endophytica]
MTRQQGRTSAPNILLVLTDQQRYDSLGTYGASAAHTPHLDALAESGAVFEQAYCPSPLCTPSRASIFTGKHVAGHGVERLYDTLPDDEILFPERLRRQGYRTALIGKLHVSSRMYERERRHPNDGFDVYEWCNEMTFDMDSPFHAYARWLQENDADFHARLVQEGRQVKNYPRHLHMTHWAAERTIEFVRDQVRDGVPFFACMSVFDPHNPYDTYPPGMDNLVGELPPATPVPDDLATVPAGVRREMRSKTLQSHFNGSLDEARRGYHAAVALIDAEVGRVLHALDELDVADDTLVIFTSDHGDMLGDRGLMTKGAFFYDPGVRVPLLMRWPGVVPAGRRVHTPVLLNDIAATAVSAAGCATQELGAMSDSLDLVPLAQGQSGPARPFVTSCYRNGGLNVGGSTTYFDPPLLATMIRDDRYKLTVYHTDGEDGVGGELFDMVSDPDESKNLWNDGAARAAKARLMQSLLDWSVMQEWSGGSRGGEWLPASSVA